VNNRPPFTPPCPKRTIESCLCLLQREFSTHSTNPVHAVPVHDKGKMAAAVYLIP
ncbi:hypothetical protein CEXT_549131, partial [Caerostris extrusa]